MRNEFQQYYRPTEQEFDTIWKDCIFAFDASVLLNLYFYSTPTTNTYLTVLALLKDRVWLPFQAGLEYQRNRIGVIGKVLKGYKDAHKSLEQIYSVIHSRSAPPFLADDLQNRFDDIVGEIRQGIDESIQKLRDTRFNDPIRDSLDALFANKVGTPIQGKQLEAIFTEGKERYKKKIPPGYMDEKEKQGDDMFGDLVIWKEAIEKAKSDSRPIILITDDAKEDWWYIQDDKTFGPRPELLLEFRSEAKQLCYLYNSESFLRYADHFLAENIDQAAINEVADAQERDRLLSFEYGYEDVETPADLEIEAAAARLEEIDEDSDEYTEALTSYQALIDRKSAETFMATVHSQLSPGAQARRAMLISEIQQLLGKCRSHPTWDSRSEYKLPSWLEQVPEEMIQYTSLPKLIRIRSNLKEYLQRHIKML